jgi:hypothetical protein
VGEQRGDAGGADDRERDRHHGIGEPAGTQDRALAARRGDRTAQPASGGASDGDRGDDRRACCCATDEQRARCMETCLASDQEAAR